MKKCICLTLLAGFCFSAPLHADYVIKLKNGREMRAEKHWQEKNYLKMKTRRGVVGVPMRMVADIIDVEDERRKRNYKYFQSRPANASAKIDENAQASGQGQGQGGKSKEEYVSHLKDKMKKEKWPAQYKKWDKGKNDKVINQKYENIKTKQQNLAVMSKEEINAYAREVDSLKKTIVSRKKTTNYASELKELYQIGSEIEVRLQQ